MPYPAQTSRERIVETACLLIEREGAEQLSLARLAAELGVKAPSLYRHIPSRAALIQAVNARTIELLFAAYEQALAGARPKPRARLLALLQAHRAFAHAHPQAYLLAFTTTADEERLDAGLMEARALPIQQLMAEISGRERSLSALRGALALAHGFAMLELKQQLRRGGDLDEAFQAACKAYLTGWEQRSA